MHRGQFNMWWMTLCGRTARVTGETEWRGLSREGGICPPAGQTSHHEVCACRGSSTTGRCGVPVCLLPTASVSKTRRAACDTLFYLLNHHNTSFLCVWAPFVFPLLPQNDRVSVGYIWKHIQKKDCLQTEKKAQSSFTSQALLVSRVVIPVPKDTCPYELLA